MAQQRLEIIDTANRMFDEFDITDTKIKAIADEVLITMPTLYRYFESKSHLILVCISERMALQCQTEEV